MKAHLHSCFTALALILSASVASANHYKLFVLTGQSNSLGTTAGGETDTTSGTDPADTHIPFFWSNIADASHVVGTSGGVFTTLKDQQGGYYAGSNTHWGPEMEFGRTLYRAGVRDFAIIKASRGGGGNSFWSKTATDHHMYTHVVNTVNAAIADLTSKGHTYEIKGLLYLQGESDSLTEANIAGTRLKELVDNLRGDLPNASNMHAIAGGIAAANATRDIVRTKQADIAASTSYIDFFPNLDLQGMLYDSLHFNKAAKRIVGERFAQAFFDAGVVQRHYGKLVFIGDSITQGGNGHPSYRYTVFRHLTEKGVPNDAVTGYKFTGSVTGAYGNNAGPTPDINGKTFENLHDGHYGWRASWECARSPLPAGRYNTSNLGQGTLLNWTGQTTTFATGNAGTLNYTGTTYTPDTAIIMIGINDLGDSTAPTQVRDDISTLIDQLRASNPKVRIYLNLVLHTNQGATRVTQVNTLNGLLPALAAAKNAISATSPVWIIDASAGFTPATQTYDNVHPNANGEAYVGDRISMAIGLLATPPTTTATSAPPHIESGSSSFQYKFEGHEIWNGTAFQNGWGQDQTLTKTIPASSPTDLQVQLTGSGAANLVGTNTGWTSGNSGNWTFETRLKFLANPAGYCLWLCTGSQRILIEIYGDRTQDYQANTFNVSHNNIDGEFHTFRVANEAGAARYHVWRDGIRITPVIGVAYDQSAADSRMLMGDYTTGTFGNNFNVVIDYVRYDLGETYLPTGADSDQDGIPDSWEYAYFSDITGADALIDEDQDGCNNLLEYIANSNPFDRESSFKVGEMNFDESNDLTIALRTSAQRFYTLYKSTDLGITDSWTSIDGPIIGIDGELLLHDLNPGERGFYKVVVSIP